MYSQMNFTLFAQLLLIVNLLRLVLHWCKRIQLRLSKVINYTPSRSLACIFMVYKRQIVRANNVLRPTILLLLRLLASITHSSFIYTALTIEFSTSETVLWLNRPCITCLMITASRPCIWKERKQQRVAVSLWLTNEEVIKTRECTSKQHEQRDKKTSEADKKLNERADKRAKKGENETTKEKLDSANEWKKEKNETTNEKLV
jgi:hypothetical protein